MRLFRPTTLTSSLIAASLVLAARLDAAEKKAPLPTPQVHLNACSLGTSMAKSLQSRNKWSQEQAEKTCKILQPTMSDEDGIEFRRCCMAGLVAGGGVPPTPEPTPGPKRRP
jgi:hypothetical protein